MRSRRCSPIMQQAASSMVRGYGLFTSCTRSPDVSESPLPLHTCPRCRPRDRMADLLRDEIAGSSDRFGYEWDSYAEILPGHEEQFRRWTAPLSPQDWQGKQVLDVGCGMGRNSFWPLKYGAAGGVAVDIDERSLESARRNLQSFPAMHVMRE